MTGMHASSRVPAAARSDEITTAVRYATLLRAPSAALAAAFLDERRSNRYNKVYNALLDGWLAVLLGADRSVETTVSAYEGGTVAENPSFSIGSRTAYTRRLAS